MTNQTDMIKLLTDNMRIMSAILETMTSKAETVKPETVKHTHCQGKRADGLPCLASGNLLNETGFCYQHRYQSETLKAETVRNLPNKRETVSLAQASHAIMSGFTGVYRLPAYPSGGRGGRSRKAHRKPVRIALRSAGFTFVKHDSKGRTIYKDRTGQTVKLHFATNYLKIS